MHQSLFMRLILQYHYVQNKVYLKKIASAVYRYDSPHDFFVKLSLYFNAEIKPIFKASYINPHRAIHHTNINYLYSITVMNYIRIPPP